jgi:hypothetical protein
MTDQKLWLWKNGDHYLAFEHEYPCYEPGGDPMVFGEPSATAIFKPSFDRSGAAPQFMQLMKFYGTTTLAALVEAQSMHIERLQAKLPPMRDMNPRTPREG